MARVSQNVGERRVLISGVGHSDVGRSLPRSGAQLTYDAVLAAVEDAGLQIGDIDGLSSTLCVPYVAGASDPDPIEIAAGMGMNLTWLATGTSGVQTWTGVGAAAIHAVAAGACRHVVVYRTVKEGSAVKQGGGRKGMGMETMQTASGRMAELLPIGAFSPANEHAMGLSAHMQRYGITRKQLGWVAVTQRGHAARNPRAVYKEPLTIDDYLAARMISSPLCLYDCDVPVDAATAFVFSAEECVQDLRHPVRIEAQGWACEPNEKLAPTDLWGRTDRKPSEVDVAQFYDGLSPFVLYALEKFEFCGPGESGAFIEGGHRTSLNGELPVNTWGGQLSAGRVHMGFGHLAEAVHQLRGEAAERQVPGVELSMMATGLRRGIGILLTTP